MTIKRDKFNVCCPACGRLLMRVSGGAEIEMKCSKCKADIVANIDELIKIQIKVFK